MVAYGKCKCGLSPYVILHFVNLIIQYHVMHICVLYKRRVLTDFCGLKVGVFSIDKLLSLIPCAWPSNIRPLLLWLAQTGAKSERYLGLKMQYL